MGGIIQESRAALSRYTRAASSESAAWDDSTWGAWTARLKELTGRKVLAFLSQAQVEPDLTIEMFLMDAPLPGFGALELLDLGNG